MRSLLAIGHVFGSVFINMLANIIRPLNIVCGYFVIYGVLALALIDSPSPENRCRATVRFPWAFTLLPST